MNVCEISFQYINSVFVYKPFSIDVLQYFVTMEKNKYRAVIEFLFLEGLKAKEIYERMLKVYKDSSPSISTVERWVAEFKRGRTSLEDDPRPGRPKTATTPEIVEKIQDIVLENRRVTERDLVEALGISLGSVSNILTEVLGFRKLCAQWVPHSLTMEQKHIRMRLSQQHLERFRQDKVDFVRRFITMDETWVYHHDPKSKQEAKEWCEPGASAPKRVRVQKSAKKVMASVFWDAKGILLVDYLQTGKTINSEYYCNLLDQLNGKIREKRPGLQKKKILFHQDNAPCHKSILTMSKIHELQFELLEHPPYSPDLAPSDFHLLPDLKKFMRGKRFSSNDEVITAVEAYFAALPDSHFRDGIHKLESRWNKCIDVQGDYTE